MTRHLHPTEIDRAIGAVTWSACGDALGAGYELATPPAADEPVEMRTGTLTGAAPDTWTDDTELAICILDGATGTTIDIDRVAARMADWYASEPADAGFTTIGALASGGRTAAELTAAARHHLRRSGRAASNGSLMRTGTVAVALLGDEAGDGHDQRLATLARDISKLTHADPLTGDACVIWSVAIDRALRGGRAAAGIDDGIATLEQDRQHYWRNLIGDAQNGNPSRFNPNGHVAAALAAAVAAIAEHDDGSTRWALDAIEAAIRAGDDTDTTAAITGALAGAVCGATAMPLRYATTLGGWPGIEGADLVRRAAAAAIGPGEHWPNSPALLARYQEQWGTAVHTATLRTDSGVTVGNVGNLATSDADAVVSLCRIGTDERRDQHLEVFCIDVEDPTANPNLDTQLADVADWIATRRRAGDTVLIHCVEGVSRTPTFAAAYLMRHHGLGARDALGELRDVTGRTRPNPWFAATLERLEKTWAT